MQNSAARARRLEYVIGSTAILTFFVPILFVTVLRYTTTYASPTAAYALNILDKGRLSSIQIPGYWGVTLFESEFPIPSLLLSTFVLVTGVPKEYAMFTPIVAVASLVYFVIAKRALRECHYSNSYVLLFSAMFYAYMVGTHVGEMYLGRATLGVMLFAYFLLAYLLGLRQFVSGTRMAPSWLLVLGLFTVAIGFTYYTATLEIAACMTLMSLAIGLTARFVKRIQTSLQMLSIAVLAVFLIAYGPFSFVIGGLSLTPGSFLDNLFHFVGTILRIEAPNETYLLSVGFVNFDLTTRITSIWIPWGMRIASGLAIVYALILYRPKAQSGQTAREIMWLFSLTVLVMSVIELAYLAVAPVPSLRFLSIYGPLVVFYCVLGFLRSRTTNTSLSYAKKALLCAVLITVLMGSVGYIGYTWQYSVAKPFAYDRIAPLSNFLASHSSSGQPVNLTADAIYSADLFFIEYLHGKTNSVVSEPLENETFTLYDSMLDGNFGNFAQRMHERGIGYLVMVNDGRPIWGDEWGYGATLPGVPLETPHLSLIYSDGQSQLFAVN